MSSLFQLLSPQIHKNTTLDQKNNGHKEKDKKIYTKKEQRAEILNYFDMNIIRNFEDKHVDESGIKAIVMDKGSPKELAIGVNSKDENIHEKKIPSRIQSMSQVLSKFPSPSM